MADNFNFKQFLMENRLGAYSRVNEVSNKQKLIDAGYSESDAEDFADEFEQGGSKVPQKVKDILTSKGKKEGYMGTQYGSSEDMAVDMLKKGITEATPLKLKGYYQILDAGTNSWNDDFQYMGKIAGGSSAGEVGEHMFIAPDAPGSFAFVSIPEADLATMVKPSMNESKDSLQEYQIEDEEAGKESIFTDAEAIGGLVITPDKNDPKYTRIEFDVHGFTQNGLRDINYELAFFPATKRVTARNKKDSSGRTQSVEGILKGGGYVDLGTDNATVPSKIQNYLKKYAI